MKQKKQINIFEITLVVAAIVTAIILYTKFKDSPAPEITNIENLNTEELAAMPIEKKALEKVIQKTRSKKSISKKKINKSSQSKNRNQCNENYWVKFSSYSTDKLVKYFSKRKTKKTPRCIRIAGSKKKSKVLHDLNNHCFPNFPKPGYQGHKYCVRLLEMTKYQMLDDLTKENEDFSDMPLPLLAAKFVNRLLADSPKSTEDRVKFIELTYEMAQKSEFSKAGIDSLSLSIMKSLYDDKVRDDQEVRALMLDMKKDFPESPVVQEMALYDAFLSSNQGEIEGMIEQDPDNSAAHYYLARMELNNKNYEAMAYHLTTAQQLEPNNYRYNETLANLEDGYTEDDVFTVEARSSVVFPQ